MMLTKQRRLNTYFNRAPESLHLKGDVSLIAFFKMPSLMGGKHVVHKAPLAVRA